MTRAGRPFWTLVATAVLFVLTTVAAALVAGHKSKKTEIILGGAKPYHALGLTASFPSGWQVDAMEGVADGAVMIAAPGDAETGRHLLVFRFHGSHRGTGHLARASAIVKAIRSMDPQAQLGTPEPAERAGTLGPFPSGIYSLMMMSPALGKGVQSAVANVAVTRDRQVLGVVLAVEGQMSKRDLRLLERVSQSISLQPDDEPSPATDELDEPPNNTQDEWDAVRKPLVEIYLSRRAGAGHPAVDC